MFYLDFTPMNQQDMIDYLGEMKDLEEKLPEMIRNVYKKCESQEECIYRNTFHSMEADGSSRDKYRSGDPVYRTYEVVSRDMDRQSQSVELEILRIRSWQEKLEHVQYSLLQIPNEQREIITDAYIKKESVKEYALRNCFGITTVRRKRKEAMDILLYHYNAYFRENHEGEGRS